MATINKKVARTRVHKRIRTKLKGVAERPRFCINFSNQHICAQIIDDGKGQTLVSVCTTEKGLAASKLRPNVKGAQAVGKLVAERAKAKKISKVVFDRGGFTYGTRVKALADAARAEGLEF